MILVVPVLLGFAQPWNNKEHELELRYCTDAHAHDKSSLTPTYLLSDCNTEGTYSAQNVYDICCKHSASFTSSKCTPCLKNTVNNSVKHWPTLIIFRLQNIEET